MSEPDLSQQQSQNQDQSAGDQPTDHPSGLENTGFRWGDDAPPELRGKTAAETLEYIREQQSRYQDVSSALAAMNQYPSVFPSAPEPPQTNPLDPDKLVTDPEAYQRDLLDNLSKVVGYTVQQQTVPAVAAMIDNARHLSKSDPKNQEIWERYGQEIEALAASPAIDPSLKASKSFWDQAVAVVKAQHADELIEEKAKQLASQMAPQVEGGQHSSYGGGDPQQQSALERIRNSRWGSRFKGYSDSKIIRAAEAMGLTLDEYAEMVEKTNPVVNPHNPSEWRNP